MTEELRRHDLPVDGLGWLEEVHVDGLAELASLARWVAVVSGQRANQGEATVLAWAEVHGAVAVVDDADARRAARRAGLPVHGVLWVVATAVAEGRISEAGATGFVDSLIDTGAYYPCRRGCFVPWAKSAGLL